jgi:hypothetical protein
MQVVGDFDKKIFQREITGFGGGISARTAPGGHPPGIM